MHDVNVTDGVEPQIDQKEFDQTILEMEEATRGIISGHESDDLEEPEELEEPSEGEPRQDSNDKEEYSELEKEAIAKGWKPKNQFNGDPGKFRSAKEYLDRGELYDALENQRHEVKLLKSTMNELLSINKRQHEMLKKEKADYLLQQKRQAIANGNIDEAEQYEKAYYDAYIPEDYPEKQQTQPDVTPDLSPAVQEFVRRNADWFNNNTDETKRMMEYAVKKSDYLSRVYPDWTEEKQLIATEKAVKEMFYNHFENKNRGKPSSVNIPAVENYSQKQKQKVTFNNLPEKYKPIVRKMAEYGGLTLDEYAQQLYNQGVVKNG